MTMLQEEIIVNYFPNLHNHMHRVVLVDYVSSM